MPLDLRLVVVLLIILSFYILYKKINQYRSIEWMQWLSSWFPASEQAILDAKATSLPWTQTFRDNWHRIRDEYFHYCHNVRAPHVYEDIDTIQSSTCDRDRRWHVVFLKAFNRETQLVGHFPETMALIRQVPTCTLAFFSVLKPRAHLQPHRGIYAGVHRYHLALQVPDDGQSFLTIDGRNIHWKEGDDILFDDMYEHSAQNLSWSQDRVVLFMDIKRQFHSYILNWLNDRIIDSASTNDALTLFLSSID